MKITQAQVNQLQAIMAVVIVNISIAKAASPLQGIPSGHLYNELQGQIDLDVYTRMINLLKAKGLLTESYHLLKTTVTGDKVAAQLREILGM